MSRSFFDLCLIAIESLADDADVWAIDLESVITLVSYSNRRYANPSDRLVSRMTEAWGNERLIATYADGTTVCGTWHGNVLKLAVTAVPLAQADDT